MNHLFLYGYLTWQLWSMFLDLFDIRWTIPGSLMVLAESKDKEDKRVVTSLENSPALSYVLKWIDRIPDVLMD